jgi:hypothetical protein
MQGRIEMQICVGVGGGGAGGHPDFHFSAIYQHRSFTLVSTLSDSCDSGNSGHSGGQ